MKAAIIVVVLGFAGFLVWQKLYSAPARVDRAYQACMKEAAAAGDGMKTELARRAPAAKAIDPSGAMTPAVRGMAQGLSGAMCGAMRDACRSDFNGGHCQTALARYP